MPPLPPLEKSLGLAILATSAGLSCVATLKAFDTLFTSVEKAWFQEHGKDVHDCLVNPSWQTASILNKTATTHLSLATQKLYTMES